MILLLTVFGGLFIGVAAEGFNRIVSLGGLDLEVELIFVTDSASRGLGTLAVLLAGDAVGLRETGE